MANFKGYNESDPSVNPEEKNNVLPENIKSSKSWSNFSEIHITGSDWSTVENYDWVQGEGTWSNPYIIENITMDASSSSTGSGIIIENSNDVYFIIRNCIITNAQTDSYDAGIKLNNTSKGTLIDNDCSYNEWAGIVIRDGSNNTVIGNTVDYNIDPDAGSNQGYGIMVYSSSNNTIYNNHAFNNKRDGIILYMGGDYNNFTFNNCSNNGRTGMHLLYAGSNNTIAYNGLTNNAGMATTSKANCRVDGSHGNYLLYNDVSYGQSGTHGIELFDADYNEIRGNIANNNDGRGISLYRSVSNKLLYNTANENQNGIYLYSSSNDNEIWYNTYESNNGYDLYISGDCFGNDVKEIVIEGPTLSDLSESSDPLEFGNNVTIQINATDSDGVVSVLIGIEGTNNTMSNIGGGDFWQYNWTPSSLGSKPYTIWANDSLGNWNSLSDSITVQDTIAPEILNVWKNDTLLEPGEILKIKVNTTDLSGVDTLLFDILGKNHTMTYLGEDSWEYNWTAQSNGTLTYTIWANDTSNNINSESGNVTVQDTIVPVFSDYDTSGYFVEVWDTFTVQVNITDLGGIDTVLFEIVGSNYTMTNIEGNTWEYDWFCDSLGLNEFNIWAIDYGGNRNNISDAFVVEDTISPNISDLYESADPVEIGDTFTVQANITDNYQLDEVLIDIFGIKHNMTNIGEDIWEYSFEPSTEGEFAYNIWVNDTSGNLNELKDAIAIQNAAGPSMTDLDESADPLELGEALTIQINITDISGVDTVLIEIQNTNYTMDNIDGDIWEFIWNPSTPGFFPYTIWANDTLNNMNKTMDYITVQDIIAPSLFDLEESGDPIELGDQITIRVNITDVGQINSTIIDINGQNYTMTYDIGDRWEFLWTPSVADNYPYTIWVNDSSGNWGSLSNNFTVQDTMDPLLSDLNEFSDPTELGNSVTIQVNVTDLSGIDTVLIEISDIDYEMSNIGGDTWEYSWVPSIAKKYNYTIKANDSNGNWNQILDDITGQDTIHPMIFGLDESSDPLERGEIMTIKVNVTDIAGINSTLIEVSGTNHSMINTVGDMWEFSWTPLSLGTILYTIWANDSNGNWNSIGGSFIVQDTTGPSFFNLTLSATRIVFRGNITIQLNITDISGIGIVLLEILGANHSMINIFDQVWQFNWTAVKVGTITFAIWANDTHGNWIRYTGSIIVYYISGSSDDPSDDTEDVIEPSVIIIIILIVIGSVAAFSGFAVRTQKQKKSSTKSKSLKDKAAQKRTRLMDSKTTVETEQDRHPHKVKAKKKSISEKSSKPLTTEEEAELAKTEKEVGIAKQKFTCIVHRGSLHGSTIYLCKHCDSFYCERCAKVLKLKGDVCWTCGNEIDIEVSENDRELLLKKSAKDLVEEIIQEKEILKDFIETDKDLDDIPQIKEYLFGIFTAEDLDKIDLLDFNIDEKKQFIREFVSLDEENRQKLLDKLLQK